MAAFSEKSSSGMKDPEKKKSSAKKSRDVKRTEISFLARYPRRKPHKRKMRSRRARVNKLRRNICCGR